MRYTLQGARLVDAMADIPAGDLVIDHGRILSDEADTPGGVIDAAGMTVLPGLIDVHTHGGGGFNLHTADPDEILAYAHWAPSTGVTAFLIGVVGAPGSLPVAQLRAAADAIARWRQGAEPLGIHLEGPFINEKRRGAHLPTWLRQPDTAEAEQVLELAQGHLRLITLAPELPEAPEMIRAMLAANVTVSLGHSDATYEQAAEAIRLGVTHATHCCNAMRPLLHRDPGPLGAIAQAPQVFGEVIADGIHVHPAMVQVLIRLLGAERTIIITDALAAAGMADMSFEFAGQPAQVIHGAARLADGTLTGSVLTMDAALRNVMRMADVTLSQASGMLSYNPARTIHADARKGLLQPGYDADLAIFDPDLRLHATICCGQLAFATPEWRERLLPLAAVAEAPVAPPVTREG